MTRQHLGSIGTAAVAAILAIVGSVNLVAGQAAGRGSIKGHVHLLGKLPGNTVIRMGADPMCSRMNAGKRVVQEAVAAAADGSLANAFVSLQGTFPQTPIPAEPVTIDQQGCIYLPRVVGVRVGQILQVKNSDNLLHNVHSSSSRGNEFNVGQPKAGMVSQFRLKQEEIVLRLRCDVHSWMTAFIAVVTHPYFSVSNTAGTFEIGNVPAGTHTIQVWHERYGPLIKPIRVTAGAVAVIDFTYMGTEKPPTAGLRDLSLPAGVSATQLAALNADKN